MAQPIWNTSAGSLGSYPSQIAMAIQLSASAVLPATSVQYALLSGTLPAGISIDSEGLIYGTPTLVTQDTVTTFTVRVTDNLSNIRDRTFSINVSGTAIPQFITPEGNILTTQDSIWIDLPIAYSNPESSNPVIIEVREGTLPPGIEINEEGIIRGYAQPPLVNITLSPVTTNATLTESGTNLITCTSTNSFTVGRPVVFSGATFGDIDAGTTYYIRTINSTTTFTITTTQNGSVFPLVNASGSMGVTLPAISQGAPTIRTYSFTLRLFSPLGSDIASYSMTVINQNTPVSQGGPGRLQNTRIPTILNTRPLTYNLNDTDPFFGYYILPPVSPTVSAPLGTFISGDYFAFKVIGYDFDGNVLSYSFSGLPSELTGDVNTGWITGTPTLTTPGISNYSFRVTVWKASNPTITTQNFNFTFNLSKEITGNIIWNTLSDLGTIFNGTISTLGVSATSDVSLSYRITSGALPPNLALLENGQITGRVADQPTSTFLDQNDSTEFTFTIQAYSDEYSIVESSKTFTLTVLQEYSQPTDTLYIKATPSISDRQLLETLLLNNTIIPENYVFRPNDVYFGKATSVVYEHAYGIYSNSIQEYLVAVTQNHYWRNITLGEIKTAVAKNSAGEIVYEVVYSEVIDNLVNPAGISVNQEIVWPRDIDLNLGPWYTSVTDIYTSYANVLGQEYYTSLSSGTARYLYPNSLFNMRNRVAQVLGQEFDSRLLPLWMTSQQSNGSTLGYTQAWVIAYTKPGYAETIKNNINTLWVDQFGNNYRLNQINFNIDRFTVDKSATYNYDTNTQPASWTGLPSGTPVPSPLDSKDFYVLFPRQTILPDESQ